MNQKDIGPLSRATSGKGKKHSPCVVGSWDQGWHNISKVSKPFPLSPLTVILLSAFDQFPGSWSRPPQTLGIYCLSWVMSCISEDEMRCIQVRTGLKTI